MFLLIGVGSNQKVGGHTNWQDEWAGAKGLCSSAYILGGLGTCSPRKILKCYEMLPRHFGDSFYMIYFCVNVCSGSKFIVGIFEWSKSGRGMPPSLKSGGQLAPVPTSLTYMWPRLQPPLPFLVVLLPILSKFCTLYLFCLPLVPATIFFGSALHALDRRIMFEPTLHSHR